MEVCNQRHAPAVSPPWKRTQVPIAGLASGQVLRTDNLFFLPGFEPRIFQPVAGPVSTVLSWPAIGVRGR